MNDPIDAVLVACRAGVAAIGAEEIVEVGDRRGALYNTRPISTTFATSEELVAKLEEADPAAIACLVNTLTAAWLPALARAISLAVLRAPELHGDELLVLYALRQLLLCDDDEAFSAVVPFAMRSWAGALIGLDQSPCPRKGSILVAYLRAHPTLPTGEPLAWPKLDEPAELPEGSHVPCWLYECMLRAAEPAAREDLLAIVDDAYRRAPTVRAREATARLLIANGRGDLADELAGSAYDSLRRVGFEHLAGRDFERFAQRFAYLAEPATASEEAQSRSYYDSVEVLRRWHRPNVLLVANPAGGPLLVVIVAQRSLLRFFDRAAGAWASGEVKLGPRLIGASVSFPKTAKGRYFTLETWTATGGEDRRLFVRRDPGGAVTVATKKADLEAGSASPVPVRAAPLPPAPVHAAPRPPPARRASSSPLEVRVVGATEGATAGVVTVPGYDVYGVFDAATGALVFAPPQAVAILLLDGYLFSWRATRRKGAEKDIGRGAYDWTLERFRWAAGVVEFIDCHTIRSREVIEWCWPLALRAAKKNRWRIVAFDCRSEDYKDAVYVVRHDDGTFSEARKREDAEAALRGEPASLVAARVSASERLAVPIVAPAPSRREILESEIADLTRAIDHPATTATDRAKAVAKRRAAERELAAL